MKSLGLKPGAYVSVCVSVDIACNAEEAGVVSRGTDREKDTCSDDGTCSDEDTCSDMDKNKDKGKANDSTTATTATTTGVIDRGVSDGSNNSGRNIICQAWLSSEIMKSAVSLTRFWMPSFADDSKRDAVVTRLSSTFIVLKCSSATFVVHSTTNSESFCFDEIVGSSAFRRYFIAALSDTVLCLNNKFSLTWRGELLTVQV